MLPPRIRWKLDRALERLKASFSDLGGGREPRPRICFDCGKLVGARENICPNCGANQSKASLSVLKRISNAMLPKENPVTYALLFTNLLFMILIIVGSQKAGGGPFDVDGRILGILGAKFTRNIVLFNEYWRLVMPIFLHGGLLHFGLNSFVLWQIGPQVEELFGPRRFFFLYLVTGIVGFMASAVWYPGGLSVGASGSLFGLIGVLLGYITQKPGFAQEYRSALIRWAVFMLILGFMIPGIDNAAHVGGLVSGFLLGKVVSDRRPQTYWAQVRLGLMIWGSAVIVVWSLVMVILHLPTAPPN